MFIDTIDYQIITNCLTNLRTNYAIASLGLSEDEITKLYSDIKIDRIILDENKKSKDENMETIMSTVCHFLFLVFI